LTSLAAIGFLKTMSHGRRFMDLIARTANALDADAVEAVVQRLAAVRESGGRVFVIGVGGSAAAASHLVNDLRKLAGLEAYTPVDNVSELTARINDDGWESCFVEWLKGSRLNSRDAVFVYSVGGGNLERNISPNIVRALQLAKEVGAAVMGVVGRDGGYTARVADACVIVPVLDASLVTPVTEAFHMVVGHALVSHPDLQTASAKWESTTEAQPG